MKRITFGIIASVAIAVAMPASALAKHHHHRHHHHARVHHERWGGGDENGAGQTGNAGVVSSFNGTTLTITLSDGSMVSGRVTGATELKCETAEDQMMRSHDDGSGRGDNGATGRNDNGGEDNSGQSESEHACSTSSLTPGTVVHDAELDVSSAGAIWQEVELITP